MKESLVINKIKKICDEMNIDFYRVHAGQYQSKGMFDCYLIFPAGYGVWVEIKTNNGKLTELQKDFFDKGHFCLIMEIDKNGDIEIVYNQACFKEYTIFHSFFIRKIEQMKFVERK